MPEVMLDAKLLNADGSLRVGQPHSRMYNAAAAGRLHMAVSASGGIALLVPATGGGHPTLWNPKGSGVNLDVRRLSLTWVSGNNAPGAVEWAQTAEAGAQVGTGSPIITATKVATTNVITGGPVDTKAYWSPTTNTFTAAPVFLRGTGISLFTGIGTTAVAPFSLTADYDGDLIVGDGTALSLCFQTTTTTALFQVCIIYEVVPVGVPAPY